MFAVIWPPISYLPFSFLDTPCCPPLSQVEVAVEALWDIARELHELQVAALKQARTGHLTSSLGSGLLGGALLGGLLTAGPLVTVGLFTGSHKKSIDKYRGTF